MLMSRSQHIDDREGLRRRSSPFCRLSTGDRACTPGNIRQHCSPPPVPAEPLTNADAVTENICTANLHTTSPCVEAGWRCSPFAGDAARCTYALELVIWDALPRRAHSAAPSDASCDGCKRRSQRNEILPEKGDGCNPLKFQPLQSRPLRSRSIRILRG